MNSIVTLSWTDNVAWTERNTRYQILFISGLHECWKFSPEITGVKLGSCGTLAEAQLLAQRDAEQIVDQVGAESAAIAGARISL